MKFSGLTTNLITGTLAVEIGTIYSNLFFSFKLLAKIKNNFSKSSFFSLLILILISISEASIINPVAKDP